MEIKIILVRRLRRAQAQETYYSDEVFAVASIKFNDSS